MGLEKEDPTINQRELERGWDLKRNTKQPTKKGLERGWDFKMKTQQLTKRDWKVEMGLEEGDGT